MKNKLSHHDTLIRPSYTNEVNNEANYSSALNWNYFKAAILLF